MDTSPVFPGLSVGDLLVLYFTATTNSPDVSSTAAVMSLLNISPVLSSSVVGQWLPGGDATFPTAQQRLALTLGGQMNANVSQTLLSNVFVSVTPMQSANGSWYGISSADGTSSPLNVSMVSVDGSWGEASQPQFLDTNGAIALDYGGQEGCGVGDAILLSFNQPVAHVAVGTKADVDEVFIFTPSNWADSYSGRWLDYNTLLLTVDAISASLVQNASHRLAIAVGNLTISVNQSGGLQSYDGTSAPSNATVVVDVGSWGDVVCDVELEVYSYRAVEVTFRPPATLNVPPPSAYQVQVSSSPVFDAGMTTASTAMSVADVTAPVLNLGGLRTGTVYYVRIAVPPSIRSIAGVTFPQPLAPLYTTPGECCVMLVRSEMCQLRGTKFGV